jgi:hypothetical protein
MAVMKELLQKVSPFLIGVLFVAALRALSVLSRETAEPV